MPCSTDAKISTSVAGCASINIADVEDNACPSGKSIGYAVIMLEGEGFVELRIPELLIAVRAEDLPTAMGLLVERKNRLIEWATRLNLLHELPPPAGPHPMLMTDLPVPRR
jgi:hypothetical protein